MRVHGTKGSEILRVGIKPRDVRRKAKVTKAAYTTTMCNS